MDQVSGIIHRSCDKCTIDESKAVLIFCFFPFPVDFLWPTKNKYIKSMTSGTLEASLELSQFMKVVL